MIQWLEIMRVSNAPTVASNVLAGVAVGMLARMGGSQVPLDTLALLVVGTLLVYTAGMILNDVFDWRTDAHERPGRPIPSGRVPRNGAKSVGFALLAAGTVALCLAGQDTTPWALLLAASVVLYDTLHRQLPCSWLVLGICRGVIVVISARAVSPGAEWGIVAWVACSLLAYVACFSVAARDEMRGLREISRAASGATALLALAPLGLLLFDIPKDERLWIFLACGVVLVLALASALLAARAAASGRSGIPVAVGSWIGVIPLLDAAVCLLLGRPGLALACIGLWGCAGALRPRIAPS